jgi:hypothetical protein
VAVFGYARTADTQGVASNSSEPREVDIMSQIPKGLRTDSFPFF